MKITEQRMEELLPQSVKDSDLSLGTKKVLTALLDWYLNSKAKDTGIITISNKKLCGIAGVGGDSLQEAFRDMDECQLCSRKAGKGIGTASEYILNFEALSKPIKRKSFEELFAKELNNTKSLENPISTTVHNSTVQDITEHNITVHNSKEHNISSQTITEQNIEEKEESFIDEFEQKEGVSLNRYLFDLFKKEGIESIENWYNTNASKFKSTSDFKRYNSVASAINGEAYKVASTLNEVGARASRRFSKQMAASMRGVEIGSAIL